MEGVEVKSLYYLVETKDYKDEDGKTNSHTTATVVGVDRKNKSWLNTYFSCQKNKSGKSVHCFVDCDGGVFNLQRQQEKYVLLSVAKGYYFPLFAPGTELESPQAGELLEFNASDPANDNFSLIEGSAEECEAAIKSAGALTTTGC